MKTKKQLEVITVPNDGVPKFYGGAFVLAFVYSDKGNFLVKGYSHEVDKYLKAHFARYFVRYTMHHKGEQRSWFHFGDKCNLAIDEPNLKRSDFHRKYRVRPYGYEHNLMAVQLTFKRFPTRWIPEFDFLIDKFGKKDGYDDGY